MDDLLLLVPTAQETLWQAFVVFLRIGALVFAAPGFGESYVPTRIKLGVSFAFTMIVLPSVAVQVPNISVGFFAVLLVALPEVVAGIFFGVVLRFYVFVLQIAGSIAAQSTSLAQIFGGGGGADAQAAIGHLLVAAGLALAALMGLHVLFASYVLQSYAMVPIGTLISAESVVSLGVVEVSKTFSLGFRLAAPFLIASIIYNVTLGIINRAMPQLMVSFVGAPAITAGAMILLILSAPMLLSIWFAAFYDFVTMPFGPAR